MINRRMLAAAAFMLSTTSFAGPNYNFAELSFSTGELDIGVSGVGSADIDQDGFKLEGSVAANENLLVRGSFASLSGDENGVDLDIDTIVIGAGWIIPINDATGVDVGLEYRTDELDLNVAGFGGASDDADGVGVSAAVHSSISDNVHVSARLSYLGSDYDGAFSIDLSGTYLFSDQFGVSLGLERLDVDDDGVDFELNQIQLGARVRF